MPTQDQGPKKAEEEYLLRLKEITLKWSTFLGQRKQILNKK